MGCVVGQRNTRRLGSARRARTSSVGTPRLLGYASLVGGNLVDVAVWEDLGAEGEDNTSLLFGRNGDYLEVGDAGSRPRRVSSACARCNGAASSHSRDGQFAYEVLLLLGDIHGPQLYTFSPFHGEMILATFGLLLVAQVRGMILALALSVGGSF